MFNDIEWEKRNFEDTCISKSERVKLYAQQFLQGHRTFIGPGDEMKWYGTRNCRPEGKWNSIAAKMVQNFKETKHPVFTSINALSRGILRQNKGKPSTQLKAEKTNSELLYKIKTSLRISSVSTEQLRVGVVNTNREKANNQEFRRIRRKCISSIMMDSVQAGEVQSLVPISATCNGLKRQFENIR